jgi:hypothetical protein
MVMENFLGLRENHQNTLLVQIIGEQNGTLVILLEIKLLLRLNVITNSQSNYTTTTANQSITTSNDIPFKVTSANQIVAGKIMTVFMVTKECMEFNASQHEHCIVTSQN